MTPLYAQDHDYSRYNVLAVDDIPLNLLLVQKMLSRFNFHLRTAANGQLALDAVEQEKPAENIPSENEAGNEKQSIPAHLHGPDMKELGINVPMYEKKFCQHSIIYVSPPPAASG